MRIRNLISLQLNADLLDINKAFQVEDGYSIPIKRNKDVIKVYDETYRALGKDSGFTVDSNYSKMNLVVSLNVLRQYRFFLTGSFKEMTARLNIPDDQLSVYEAKQEITLVDNELLAINKVIKDLF